MLYLLTDKLEFPDVSTADFDGWLAKGGDLSVERLSLAYSKGIFPWFNEGEAIQWWAPDPRFVIFPEELKVSKSMKQLFKKNAFQVTVNNCFNAVITNCAKAKRKDQPGTWITQQMIEAYINLHHAGKALSVEVWKNNELVGGLYGVVVGNGVFSGESMFAKVSNASKYGFIHFVQSRNYELIDCQTHSNHLESLGGRFISRVEFGEFLTSD